jgi:hypothetical protein
LVNANQQKDQGTSHMDVDPDLTNKEISVITIEKGKEYVTLVPYSELLGGKAAKITKIKHTLQMYNIQYNKQLPITQLGKLGAKITFNDKEKYEAFLKAKIIIQEKKEDSDEVINVKLQPKPAKPENISPKVGNDNENSDNAVNSNSRIIQIIDIPAFRNVREIKESFEIIGEIEKLYTRGTGLYQVTFITYKDVSLVEYFYTHWSFHINKDIVRVLLLQLSKEDREHRKKFSLRLSGLYYQTSGYDLKEVLKYCKGQTCFIPAFMLRSRYQHCRYAYINFATKEDMNAAYQMTIEFKKRNANPHKLFWSKEDDQICNICGCPSHMAKDCTNKEINKGNSKKFVSGADNWKKLKKSYAEVAKSKSSKNSTSKSRDHNQGRNNNNNNNKNNCNYNNIEAEDEDFNQHPTFIKFKNDIINNMRKIEEKLMNMEIIMKNTDQQIAEIVTTQKVIRCEKVNAPPLPSKKKSNKKDQLQSQVQDAGKDAASRKRTCKSDTESEADKDETTEKVICQSQQF